MIVRFLSVNLSDDRSSSNLQSQRPDPSYGTSCNYAHSSGRGMPQDFGATFARVLVPVSIDIDDPVQRVLLIDLACNGK